MNKGVKNLAKMIKESEYTVVLTGAGMDTESNIPDFRGKDGWWENIDPIQVASIHTFESNYPLFHEFYSMRIKTLEGVEPHKGHYVLADLEKKGLIHSIATQNVSGLHQKAGSNNVYELHGNIRTIRCNHCNKEVKLEDFLAGENCSFCGKKALRPNVVLFGEALPIDVWIKAEEDIKKSQLLIIIGTSLEVYPVNFLPMYAKGKIVLINNEDINANYEFDIKLIGKAGEILKELEKYVE
ncbi:NAD-dependent deacylase [Keratinibaculum paraultunense]|nr:NAD-dependent deacylase [Keratinibaculum paraultunense]